MASASSLLGLVNQIQSMELSFASVLMEAAMKLSNLTDANIFFLIETPQGRKFSGKRHLCDSYLNGSLAAHSTDVEYEIDPSISALHERFPFGDVTETIFDDSFRAFVPPRGVRRWNGPSPSSSRNGKRHNDRTMADNSLSPAKRSRGAEEGCKTEPASVGVGDIPLVSLDADEAASTASGLLTAASGLEEAVDWPAELRAGDDGVVGWDDVVNRVQARISETKLVAFSAVSDPSVYMKGSVQNRLAVSVCYDFGKGLAEFRPPDVTEETSKNFLKANFDRWILQFQNLAKFLNVMIPNGNPERGTQFSFMGMLRKAARSGYTCRGMKKNPAR